jgi:hypothetical protein
MKLEDLVTNRELSQKLEDLGVPQNSHFYWRLVGNGEYRLEHYEFKDNVQDGDISAFTLSELGDITEGLSTRSGSNGAKLGEIRKYEEDNMPNFWNYHEIPDVNQYGEFVFWLIENEYIDVSILRLRKQLDQRI